jgi:hypothetical protein
MKIILALLPPLPHLPLNQGLLLDQQHWLLSGNSINCWK